MRPIHRSSVSRLTRVIEAMVLARVRPLPGCPLLLTVLEVLRVGVLPDAWAQCAHFRVANLSRLLPLPRLRRALSPVRRHATSASGPRASGGTSLHALDFPGGTSLPHSVLLTHMTIHTHWLSLLIQLASVGLRVVITVHLAVWTCSILRLPHSILVHEILSIN